MASMLEQAVRGWRVGVRVEEASESNTREALHLLVQCSCQNKTEKKSRITPYPQGVSASATRGTDKDVLANMRGTVIRAGDGRRGSQAAAEAAAHGGAAPSGTAHALQHMNSGIRTRHTAHGIRTQHSNSAGREEWEEY